MPDQAGGITSLSSHLAVAAVWGWAAFAGTADGGATSPAAPAATRTAATQPVREVRVICPAIEADERQRTCHWHEPERPVELVVLGTITKWTEREGSDNLFEVTVQKVLYGSLPGKSVTFAWPWQIQERTPLIFSLVPTVYEAEGAPWAMKYFLAGEEARAAEALAAARLDYHVLASESILVGKELAADEDYHHTVEVVRSLYGPTLKAGERVTVEMGGYTRWSNHSPSVRGAPMLYFVCAIRTKKNGTRLYYLDCRQPADQEPKVLEALQRRNEYPLVEEESDGEPVRCREVLFRGSTAEAIEMMGSSSEGAVTLAARTLMNRRKEATPAVLTAVERDLLVQKTDRHNAFRRLHMLIRLLGALGQAAPEGAAGRLVETVMSHIASAPPEPPKPVREPDETYWKAEEQYEDVNHALAWLLVGLDEAEVVKRYGERLLKLRDEAKGGWKQEVQLALDAARVEDNMELSAALARMRDARPVRSAAPFGGKGDAVAFSPSGKYLAVGTEVWRTEGWSRAGGIKMEGTIDRVVFSPDERSLYVFGGGAGEAIHARVDWRGGKVDRTFSGHKAGLFWGSLTPDGKTMVTADYYEGTIHIWNVAEGAIERSLDLPEHCYCVAMSPDGRTLAWQSRQNTVSLQRLDGPEASRVNIADGMELDEIIFSADSRLLVAACVNWDSANDEERVLIEAHDLSQDGKRVAQASLPGRLHCTCLAASGDSKYLAVAEGDGRVWALTLPDLRPVREVLPPRNGGRGDVAFSPDGKILVVGDSHGHARLFQVGTFECLPTTPGHMEGITELHFSHDGQALRSLGRDETVCVWDAATLKIRSRVPLPAGYKPMGMRPDGRYVLCFDREKERASFQYYGDQTNPAKVVDADTGKVACNATLPMGQFGTDIHWIDEQEALVATRTRLCRLNYHTGKIAQDLKIDHEAIGMGELTEDGASLFLVNSSMRGRRVSAEVVDIHTGRSRTTDEREMKAFTGNAAGLVPGGRYFYVADPGMYIFDRAAAAPVAERRFKNVDLLQIAFSRDGRRYAVVTGGRISVDDRLRFWDPHTESIVRVHDTLSGRTLLAFPAPTRWLTDLRFSPDGKRLALARVDGAIEVWDLPEVK